MRHRLTLLFLVGFAAVLTAGWIGFPRALYVTESQPFNFNHRLHKDQAAQKCVDCHSGGAAAALATCAGCHPEPVGTTQDEKILVASYIKPGREIVWKSSARQPVNVRFPHDPHVDKAKIACDKCHGAHGESTTVGLYQEDRISGYSRGALTLSMSACEDCHRQKGVEAGCLGCHK
jgi:hypothetical protein